MRTVPASVPVHGEMCFLSHMDFEFPGALAGIDYLVEQIPTIPTAFILRTRG